MAIKYSFDYIYKGVMLLRDARESNDLVVVANADIMFDRSIWMVQTITPDEVYAFTSLGVTQSWPGNASAITRGREEKKLSDHSRKYIMVLFSKSEEVFQMP